MLLLRRADSSCIIYHPSIIIFIFLRRVKREAISFLIQFNSTMKQFLSSSRRWRSILLDGYKSNTRKESCRLPTSASFSGCVSLKIINNERNPCTPQYFSNLTSPLTPALVRRIDRGTELPTSVCNSSFTVNGVHSFTSRSLSAQSQSSLPPPPPLVEVSPEKTGTDNRGKRVWKAKEVNENGTETVNDHESLSAIIETHHWEEAVDDIHDRRIVDNSLERICEQVSTNCISMFHKYSYVYCG